MSDTSTHNGTHNSEDRQSAHTSVAAREPFALAPDPSHFYPSAGQVGAYNRLIAGLENGARVVAAFGGPGSGKTLLMRRMEQDLAARGWVVHSAYRAVFSFQEFLESCCRKLGEEQPPQGLNAQLNTLHRLLTDSNSRLAVLLDEADSTRDQVLDAVTRLSQLSKNDAPLIQVAAFGQQALSRKLRALASRPALDIQASLRPYSDDDVSAYVLWELRECGLEPRTKFSSGAIRELCATSGGVPGRVNLLCASALLEGELINKLPVTAQLLRDTAGGLGMHPFGGAPDESSWFRDDASYVDDAASGVRQEPVLDMDVFDAGPGGAEHDESALAAAWPLEDDELAAGSATGGAGTATDHSLPLLERAAPLIDDPFVSAFDQIGTDIDPNTAAPDAALFGGSERRFAPRKPDAGQSTSDADRSSERPMDAARASAPRPQQVDIDLGGSLSDVPIGGDEFSSDFSLDSLAIDHRTPASAPISAPTRVPAPPPTVGPNGGHAPRVRGARSVFDDADRTVTQSDLLGRSEPVPVDWAGRTGELTEEDFEPVRKVQVGRAKRETSLARRWIRALGAVIVVLGALIAGARTMGVPPAVATAWAEHAPPEVRDLPGAFNNWLDTGLARVPWPERLPDWSQALLDWFAAPDGSDPAPTDGSAGAQESAGDGRQSRSARESSPLPPTDASSRRRLDEEVARLSERVRDMTGQGGNARATPAASASEAAGAAQPDTTQPAPSAPDVADTDAPEPAVQPTPNDGDAPDAATRTTTPIARDSSPPVQSAASAEQPPAPAASEALPDQDSPADGPTPPTETATDEPVQPVEVPPVAIAQPPPAEAQPTESPAEPTQPGVNAVAPREPAGREPPLLASSVQGREDEPIGLDVKVGRQLQGRALTLELYGVPRGATLSAGRADGDAWRLPAVQHDGLTLTPAPDSDRDFALQWRLTDDATGELLDTARSTVVVEAQADPPTVSAKASPGDQFTPIPVEISAAASDRDGSERVSVVITGAPPSAPLSPGRRLDDGSWLLRLDQLEGLIVTPGEGAPTNIELTVTAVSKERNNGHEARSATTVSFGVVPGARSN